MMLWSTPKKKKKPEASLPKKNVVALAFEASPIALSARKKKTPVKDAPPLNWREEGLLPTVPVKVAEGIRAALDLMDGDSLALESEGLWRECGNAKKVKTLSGELRSNGALASVRACLQEDPCSVASAIKQCLREFQPLTTYSRCLAFVDASKETDDGKRRKRTKALLRELPAINRQLLGRFAEHFSRVLEKNKKMTWTALGLCVGPSLARKTERLSDSLQSANVESKAIAKAIARLLDDLKPPMKPAAAKQLRPETAADRCVRVRYLGGRSLDIEASLVDELKIFGKLKKIGFKPNLKTTEAIVLFDTSHARALALRAKQTLNWRIDSLTPSKTKENITEQFEHTTGHRTQRIVRAFTPTANDAHSDFSASKRYTNVAYSMSDLSIVTEEDHMIDDLLNSSNNNNNKHHALGTANW